ncbi:protein artichoke [Scaptodrosophila lebanonensis]|uniref:Protein artichoke n=1 Tax=Drosophila lebanonensis TaxID=7225 RepID=A0A6J2TEY9_DROLE|nr:protein artichoke [Scaptodrosophila lebanonensis]
MYARKQLISLLWILSTTLSHADEDIVTDNMEDKHLRNINSLRENCDLVESRCQGFNFPMADEVAFFDLQTEVRIAPDGATYQLGGEKRMERLTFENSTFVNFPLHLFYELELKELDMRGCNVRHVTWDAFLMANKLQVLLLSRNNIHRLEASVFGFATELQYLFLDGNKLRHVHAQTFKGLRKLRHLDLSENRLNILPDHIFDDLEQLREVVLAQNRLRAIGNELFAHNSQLLIVSLHTNRLRELGEYAFRSPMQQQQREQAQPQQQQDREAVKPRQQLLNLDLSHNEQLNVLVLNLNAGYLWARNCSLYRVNVYGSVTNVDLSDNRLMELYFSAPEALQHLQLRNNSLAQLASLSRVPNLQHLDVSDNPALKELPAGWQTPALELLDISNTSHTEMPMAALEGMPQLRKLNVSANNLTEIDPNAFDRLSHLTHFYIHANNWNCYNLNLIMDLLIRPHGITYTVDAFDQYFPGQYINGIACMYRLPEDDDSSNEFESRSLEPRPEIMDTQASASVENLQELKIDPALEEVNKLRQELKVVVQHFEEKLDRVSEQFNALDAKMKAIETLNSTFWKQVTITV